MTFAEGDAPVDAPARLLVLEVAHVAGEYQPHAGRDRLDERLGQRRLGLDLHTAAACYHCRSGGGEREADQIADGVTSHDFLTRDADERTVVLLAHHPH